MIERNGRRIIGYCSIDASFIQQSDFSQSKRGDNRSTLGNNQRKSRAQMNHFFHACTVTAFCKLCDNGKACVLFVWFLLKCTKLLLCYSANAILWRSSARMYLNERGIVLTFEPSLSCYSKPVTAKHCFSDVCQIIHFIKLLNRQKNKKMENNLQSRKRYFKSSGPCT
jgi:hypothetical protein